jgi:hypothetical protein
MQILEKRTSENVWYDIDCTDLLNTAETIIGTPEITADQAGMSFGTAVVNTSAITYPDGRVAAIGKVIRVKIAGGVIPAGKENQLYTVRAKFGTTDSGNQREATVLLSVKDKVL